MIKEYLVWELLPLAGLSMWFLTQRTHRMIADQVPNYDLFVKMVSPLTAGGDGAPGS
jgi:hypothetical protein